jgi:hypothetical protein
MKNFILVCAMLMSTTAMAISGGDVGSMGDSSNQISGGSIIDLREKPKLTAAQLLVLAKLGAVFVAHGAYAENTLIGAPVGKAKADARALAESICTEAGATHVQLGKFSNKKAGRQEGGGTMYAEIDLSARCLFN